MPPVKIHCSILAEDAIKAAVADYKTSMAPRRQTSAAGRLRAGTGAGGRRARRTALGNGWRQTIADPMTITLTESAAKHVASRLAKRGKGVGLRLGVRTSGCSGSPTRSSTPTTASDDLSFQCHGVTVIVDPKSLQFLDGTELDFAREGLNEGFKFNNPNVKDACGCGESFNV